MKLRGFLLVGYFILCVIVGAVADGLFDEGQKVWGHLLGALELGLLMSGPFLFKLDRRHWIAFIVAYICFRVVGFDYVYNLVRGLPMLKTGTTSAWDLVIMRAPPHGVIFMRTIFLIVGVGVSFKDL